MGLSLIAWYVSPAFLAALVLCLVYWGRLAPAVRFAGVGPILLASVILALCFSTGTWSVS